jgi:hypothetical protein
LVGQVPRLRLAHLRSLAFDGDMAFAGSGSVGGLGLPAENGLFCRAGRRPQWR